MSQLALSMTLAASGVLLLAQDKAAAPAVPVQMTVTVEARHGKDTPSLNREDVMVFDGKQRLPVTDLMAGEAAGLELFLLIDDAAGDSLGSQLKALQHFVDAQPASTAIGLGYMRNGTAAIAQNFTTDHALAAKALRLPLASPGASPSPFLSLSDLIKRWPPSTARHEVLMITSGIDPLGGNVIDQYLDIAIEQAQRTGVIVYAIYTPSAGRLGRNRRRADWGQNHLTQLAKETGGDSFMLGLGSQVSFDPYLDKVAERLRHQYRIGFEAKARNKAGLQPVRITTEVPNGQLVAAPKVWVPASL